MYWGLASPDHRDKRINSTHRVLRMLLKMKCKHRMITWGLKGLMLMSEQLFQTYSLFVLSWITRWVVTVVAFFSHNKIISEPFDFFWPFVVFFFLTLISSLMKDYFFKPPINKISLNFLKSPLEKAYRSSYKEEVHTSTQTHFSTQLFDDPTSDCDFDTLRWLTWGLTKNSTQQKRGLPTWIRKKEPPKNLNC